MFKAFKRFLYFLFKKLWKDYFPQSFNFSTNSCGICCNVIYELKWNELIVWPTIASFFKTICVFLSSHFAAKLCALFAVCQGNDELKLLLLFCEIKLSSYFCWNFRSNSKTGSSLPRNLCGVARPSSEKSAQGCLLLVNKSNCHVLVLHKINLEYLISGSLKRNLSTESDVISWFWWRFSVRYKHESSSATWD